MSKGNRSKTGQKVSEETRLKISKSNILNIFSEHPICSIEGCNKLAGKAQKRVDGTWNYKKICSTHHRLKYGIRAMSGRERIDNRVPCSICGWDKASCDRHRIEYKRRQDGYTKGNVIIVCPNCHRLMHANHWKLNKERSALPYALLEQEHTARI